MYRLPVYVDDTGCNVWLAASLHVRPFIVEPSLDVFCSSVKRRAYIIRVRVVDVAKTYFQYFFIRLCATQLATVQQHPQMTIAIPLRLDRHVCQNFWRGNPITLYDASAQTLTRYTYNQLIIPSDLTQHEYAKQI